MKGQFADTALDTFLGLEFVGSTKVKRWVLLGAQKREEMGSPPLNSQSLWRAHPGEESSAVPTPPWPEQRWGGEGTPPCHALLYISAKPPPILRGRSRTVTDATHSHMSPPLPCARLLLGPAPAGKAGACLQGEATARSLASSWVPTFSPLCSAGSRRLSPRRLGAAGCDSQPHECSAQNTLPGPASSFQLPSGEAGWGSLTDRGGTLRPQDGGGHEAVSAGQLPACVRFLGRVLTFRCQSPFETRPPRVSGHGQQDRGLWLPWHMLEGSSCLTAPRDSLDPKGPSAAHMSPAAGLVPQAAQWPSGQAAVTLTQGRQVHGLEDSAQSWKCPTPPTSPPPTLPGAAPAVLRTSTSGCLPPRGLESWPAPLFLPLASWPARWTGWLTIPSHRGHRAS